MNGHESGSSQKSRSLDYKFMDWTFDEPKTGKRFKRKKAFMVQIKNVERVV